MALPQRKTARLRFGRNSRPGAAYFVTFCTKDRCPALRDPAIVVTLVDILRSAHAANDIGVLAACIMPDHIHLLFTLGERLHLGQVIGKIKSLSRLRNGASWQWQEESFERQLRSGDSIEDYAFYCFMNPYRAGLCPLHLRWAGWFCPTPELFGFLAKLNPDTAVPGEWIGLSVETAGRIVVRT